jgi:hypothetical protein
MIHERVLFGYDYDDEKRELIARDDISNYGFFSTFTLMITSIMQVYRRFGVLVESIDSKKALYLMKKEKPLDFDMYNYLFKIDKNYEFPNLDINMPVPTSPDDHHTLYKEEYAQYYHPFFKKYFSLSDELQEKYNFLINKYNINFEKMISIVFRDSDKWTDFGGFNYVSAGAYLRLAKKVIESDSECDRIFIQTENDGVKRHFGNGVRAEFIEETKTSSDTYNAPLSSIEKDVLDWASYYICALYIHSKSKHLITYTGNSSFFLYLSRGTTKNMHQEITFTKDFNDFFIKNN